MTELKKVFLKNKDALIKKRYDFSMKLKEQIRTVNYIKSEIEDIDKRIERINNAF